MREKWMRITAIVLAVLMALSGISVGLTMFMK